MRKNNKNFKRSNQGYDQKQHTNVFDKDPFSPEVNQELNQYAKVKALKK